MDWYPDSTGLHWDRHRHWLVTLLFWIVQHRFVLFIFYVLARVTQWGHLFWVQTVCESNVEKQSNLFACNGNILKNLILASNIQIQGQLFSLWGKVVSWVVLWPTYLLYSLRIPASEFTSVITEMMKGQSMYFHSFFSTTRLMFSLGHLLSCL